MTTDQSVFQNAQPVDPTVVNNQQPNAPTSVFEGMVGQGKKFQTPEDLARSKQESDAFIDQLKRENAQMREDLSKTQSAKEIAEQLRNEFSALKSNPETPSANSPEELAKIVDSLLTRKEQERSIQTNVQSTEQAVVSKFGSIEAGRKAIDDKANELGVKFEYLANMAATTPKLFYSLMGMEPAKVPTTPQSATSNLQVSSSNPSQLPSNPDQLKQYYMDMRKNDPNRYYSGKVQQEYFEAVKSGKIEL